MRYSIAFVAAAIASSVSAHGVITQVQGANGVTMPGLSAIDGTPRDSGNPLSGSEADTSIIRAKEMGGKASALGRTQGGGPVDAAAAISNFMGNGAAGGAAPLPKPPLPTTSVVFSMLSPVQLEALAVPLAELLPEPRPPRVLLSRVSPLLLVRVLLLVSLPLPTTAPSP